MDDSGISDSFFVLYPYIINFSDHPLESMIHPLHVDKHGQV